MTLKERIENNLTIFFIGAIILGFTAGFGAYKAILEITKAEVESKADMGEFKTTIKEKYNNEISFMQTEVNSLRDENEKLKNQNNELITKSKRSENKLINEHKSEIEKLKDNMNQLKINSELEKKAFMKDKAAQLGELEKELRKEKQQLAKDKKILYNVKIAQNYMDKYLDKYAYVDLTIDEDQVASANIKDYRAAKSLLNALEAVARRISHDNKFLDFVYDQSGGGPGGFTSP